MNHSIFLLGHNTIELFESKLLVRLGLIQNMSVMHHLGYLLVRHRLPQLTAHVLYLLYIDYPAQVRIIQVKYLLQALLTLRISQLSIDHL